VTRRARLLRPLVVVVAIGLGPSAFGFELPADLPTRNDGLWIIDQTGTISDGETTFEVQKIWSICLDGKADRALHELDVREQQASVATLNETCNEPQPTLSGNVLSWTMHCAGPSPIEDKIGKSDIRNTTTFEAHDETHSETVIINRDNLVQSHGRFHAEMKRTGICEGGLKPGDMILKHWRVNGEETLKARQRRNVHDEIANHKAFTASRLGR